MSTFRIAVFYLYALWKLRKFIFTLLLFDVLMMVLRLIAGLAEKVVNF